MTDVIASARGLVKRFGDRTVLGGVDLDVRAGETLALVGPSGGGKSTLLRVLGGLAAFDGGALTVGGHEVAAGAPMPREARRLACMIFQDFQLFPHMTAEENVMVGPRHALGRTHEEARATATRLLARMGLADRAGAVPHELSGGQKQRVAIARALAVEPRVLLCDEITSALDPELKHEVRAVLEGLAQEGMTLVLVTHEIALARRVSQRVAVLDGGRVLEEGSAAEVLDRPREARTREFLDRVLG
jgi:ABC-type polar amino acid transport system ATPase subunit